MDVDDITTRHCLRAIGAGAAVSFILAIEHIVLWDQYPHPEAREYELLPLVSYVAGTTPIAVAVASLALARKHPQGAIDMWIVLGMAGVTIGGLRLYRRWLRNHDAGLLENGRLAGLAGSRRLWNATPDTRHSTGN